MEQYRFGHPGINRDSVRGSNPGNNPRSNPSGCAHLPVWVGRVAVTACPDCAEIDWFSSSGPIDPAEGMAALFGNYDLVGPIDALGAPTRQVLVYQPPSSRQRSNLEAIPAGVWLKAGPNLWMAHDGELLLLAPTDPLLFENLCR